MKGDGLAVSAYGPRAVVLVDDEPAVLASLGRLLRREPYEVLATGQGREALRWTRERVVGLVLADERMPAITGTELLREVARISPETARILLTGHPGPTVKLTSFHEGIFHLFYKPWNDDTLKRTIRRLLERSPRVRATREGGLP